jgi:acyl dehydratase
MRIFASPEELLTAVGQRLGSSAFRSIDQGHIGRFAELTADRQWIHTDPRRAAAGPFGAPVAHGFLTLSLLTAMLAEIVQVRGSDLVLNTGLDRVRFSRPVPAGAAVRLVADLAQARTRPRGFTAAVFAVTCEIDGERGPAYRANQHLLYHRADAGSEDV